MKELSVFGEEELVDVTVDGRLKTTRNVIVVVLLLFQVPQITDAVC